jgi:hypothetical protein
MRWKKRGLVWANVGTSGWSSNSALTPTPFLLNDDVVRVYAGFRDHQGVSRIGYVDLDASDPCRVLAVSDKPALDIGRAGCFDDNGVILGDVVRCGDEIRMYYVGFQLVNKVKFLAFTGLAISKLDGSFFVRLSEAPILDRVDGASTIQALHSIIETPDGWCAWIARGNGWEIKDGISYPRYDIWQINSNNGIKFDSIAEKAISLVGDEYRIGRPSVFKRPDESYGMFYTAGYLGNSRYDAGLAISSDGQTWIRTDDKIGLTTGNPPDFDHLHLCYPRLFNSKGRYYAVYNGNNMGVDGFGIAELLEW